MSAVVQILDAGNDRTLRTLSGPASKKKRQGTKSRDVGHRLSREPYGDLNEVRSWDRESLDDWRRGPIQPKFILL